ncbi:helix-turn-helix domain-containing protein [Acidobacteriota bacterium]
MDIKALRKQRGFRQIDLAKKADISISWLWVLENGFHLRVSEEKKKRVADVLGVRVRELFN